MCVPGRVVTNDDLARELAARNIETSDEWIFSRTGIRERRLLADGEKPSMLARGAATMAIADAGLAPTDIDCVIVCTYTADRLCPSTACVLQHQMGMRQVPAFDLNAACSGFIYGTHVADAMIRAGAHRHVLVVGVEGQTRFVDWNDRTTCILFGDAAGATVMGPITDGSDRGYHAVALAADGSGAEMITINYGGAAFPFSEERAKAGDYCIKMNGKEVFKFAVRGVATALDEGLRQAGMTHDQVDVLIPHQANVRIIDSAAERLKLPKERVFVNIDRYGNTAAASIPLALCEAVQHGRLKRGQVAALVGFGGGFTYGAALLKY